MSLPSVLEVETAALTAWPGLYTAHDGHWVWRVAAGYSNRANSIQCLDAGDGGGAAARIARFSELFFRHGVQPAFKLSPLTAPEIGTALDTLQWEHYEPSRVLRLTMGARKWTPAHHTALFDPNDRQWLSAQAQMSGYDEATAQAVRRIVERIACDCRGILAYDRDGLPAAAALAAVANGVGIFGNVVSRPSHRGQGFGRSAMEAALGWVRDAGAYAAAIQVAATNAVALGLYASLGFGEPYEYSYRRPRRNG